MNDYAELKVEKIFLPGIESKSFTNHKLRAGKSGSGKSNACEFEIVQEVGKKKVIDIYDSGRFENMLYCFKEDNPFKIKQIEELSNYAVRPHATPNEIILIPGRNIEFFNELPDNKDGQGVFLKAFKEENLSLGDVAYLLGKSDALRGLLDYIANEMEDDDVSFDKIHSFLKAERKLRSIPFYMIASIIRYIIRWKRSGMFSKSLEYIDIEKSCLDKDKITSYSTFMLEPEEEPIAYFMILKQIFQLKQRKKIPHRIRIYVREVANFFGEGYELCRLYLLKMQREGRDIGIDIMVDTQRPGDLPPKYRRQFGYYYQMKADFADAEKILEIQEIPKQWLQKIPNFDVGQSVLATGMRWDQPVLTPPAPHKHKEPWFDVMGMLKEKYGVKVYNSENILSYDEPDAMETKGDDDDEAGKGEDNL